MQSAQKLTERIQEWVGDKNVTQTAVEEILWALAINEELGDDFNVYVRANREDLARERRAVDLADQAEQADWELGPGYTGGEEPTQEEWEQAQADEGPHGRNR